MEIWDGRSLFPKNLYKLFKKKKRKEKLALKAHRPLFLLSLNFKFLLSLTKQAKHLFLQNPSTFTCFPL